MEESADNALERDTEKSNEKAEKINNALEYVCDAHDAINNAIDVLEEDEL